MATILDRIKAYKLEDVAARKAEVPMSEVEARARDASPVRGFAVVHVLGILTSMFSAVFFSRGLINLWYGSRKRLGRLAIG